MSELLANFAAGAGEATRLTFAPEGPAGLLRVTVIIGESTPPNALETLDETVEILAGEIVITAVLDIEPSFAVTVKDLVESTG